MRDYAKGDVIMNDQNDQKNHKNETTGAVPMDTASASSPRGGSGASKGAGASGGGGGPATLSFRDEVKKAQERIYDKVGSIKGDIDDIKGGILEITKGADRNTDRLIEKLGDVGTQMETHILDGVEDKLVVVSRGDRGHVTREHGKTRDWATKLAVTDQRAVLFGVIVGLIAAAGAAIGFHPWCQGNLVALGFMSLAGGSIPGTLVCAGINRCRLAKLLPAVATVDPSKTAAVATSTATVAPPASVTPPAPVANPAAAA